MKRSIKNIFYILLSLILVSGCGKDNYDPHKSMLEGQIVYNNKPIGVRGSNQAVQLQLYQDGYEKTDAIPVYVTQDGSFQATLFDGEYKLVTRDNNGPWVNSRDTSFILVKGHTQCRLEVTPYFTLSGETITMSNQQITAQCTVNKIVDDATVNNVTLFVSKTSFVDEGTYIANISTTDINNGTVTITLDVSENEAVQEAKFLYARIGLKITGVGQAIYSDIIQLK
ncbi:MAG: DUF3823 domain-containing protein [Tannerellaceae bacterium]|nr:DUF3823 domain-containing protein [Tannerellaceae bacterium]